MTRTERLCWAEAGVLNLTALLSHTAGEENHSVLVTVCSMLGTAFSLPVLELPFLSEMPLWP